MLAIIAKVKTKLIKINESDSRLSFKLHNGEKPEVWKWKVRFSPRSKASQVLFHQIEIFNKDFHNIITNSMLHTYQAVAVYTTTIRQ